jgi:hypothetical protein
MKILAIPENISIANDLLSYKATYRLKGDKLTVKRVFDDKTPDNVCTPQAVNAYNKLVAKVRQNLKEQVVCK